MILNVSANNFELNADYNIGTEINGDVDSSFSIGGKLNYSFNTITIGAVPKF